MSDVDENEQERTEDEARPSGSEPPAAVQVPQPEQLDLGELIKTLEQEDPAKVMPVGFYGPHAYRGYYDEVAFEVCPNVTVGDMLAAANSAVGSIYEGWKGGDYTMTLSTPVWLVLEEGCCGEQLGAVSLWAMLRAASGKGDEA